jgi:hypothetical protein
MSFRNDGTPGGVEACTPSDTAFVDYVGFYVGTTGNVVVQTTAGTSVTFTAVPAGAMISGRFIRIMSTNTTASNIVGFKAN